MSTKTMKELEELAGNGDFGAVFELGQRYYNGIGVNIDYAKAREYFEVAAENGSQASNYYLGKIYYRIVTSIFFILVNVFLYFLLLRLINCGVIHPYFLLMILLGFFVGNSKTRVLRFLFRKK